MPGNPFMPPGTKMIVTTPLPEHKFRKLGRLIYTRTLLTLLLIPSSLFFLLGSWLLWSLLKDLYFLCITFSGFWKSREDIDSHIIRQTPPWEDPPASYDPLMRDSMRGLFISQKKKTLFMRAVGPIWANSSENSVSLQQRVETIVLVYFFSFLGIFIAAFSYWFTFILDYFNVGARHYRLSGIKGLKLFEKAKLFFIHYFRYKKIQCLIMVLPIIYIILYDRLQSQPKDHSAQDQSILDNSLIQKLWDNIPVSSNPRPAWSEYYSAQFRDFLLVDHDLITRRPFSTESDIISRHYSASERRRYQKVRITDDPETGHTRIVAIPSSSFERFVDKLNIGSIAFIHGSSGLLYFLFQLALMNGLYVSCEYLLVMARALGAENIWSGYSFFYPEGFAISPNWVHGRTWNELKSLYNVFGNYFILE